MGLLFFIFLIGGFFFPPLWILAIFFFLGSLGQGQSRNVSSKKRY